MASRPVVLVTGAARRVGRAIALELAAAGFDLALHYRSSHDEVQATADDCRRAGARAEPLQADLADEAQAQALVPAARAALQRVDAVVNNASAFEYDTPASFGYERLERMMRANAAPAVVLATALVGQLEPDATGCVVNLLDQKLWNPNPDYFAYTMSKAALEAATTMMAMALAPRVRVCGVAPGLTLSSGPMTPEEFERARRLTPLQRSSTPQDVARSVCFLLQSPAITGTTLLVDGGQHLLGQPRDVMFLARDGAPPAR